MEWNIVLNLAEATFGSSERYERDFCGNGRDSDCSRKGEAREQIGVQYRRIVEQEVDEGEDQKPEFGVEGDKAFEAALTKAQSYMKKFSQASDIPDSDLPESLDFRNIDGYDFTSYFRN